MGWFSTHSGRWSPPLFSGKNPFLWAAFGFCDTEKQSMVRFWPPKWGVRACVKNPKLLSAGAGLFDSRKCWESIGRVINEQDIKNIHKWQSGNQLYPRGELESMRDCSSRSQYLWWRGGGSRVSRRDCLRSLHQRCPLPTRRGTWELRQHRPTSRMIQCPMGHHHSCLCQGA